MTVVSTRINPLGRQSTFGWSPLLVIFCSTCIFSPGALAHHVSASGGFGHTGTVITESAATVGDGQWAVGFQNLLIDFDAFTDEELQNIAAAGFEEVHNISSVFVSSLGLAYGVTANFELDLRLSFLARNGIREGELNDGEPAIGVLGDSTGIGDLTLLGKYRITGATNDGFDAALIVGLQIPTGDTSKSDASGERFEAEFQLGTGAWNPILGLAVSRTFDKFSFGSNVLYTAVSRGSQDTNLGDNIGFNVAFSRRLGGNDHMHVKNKGAEHGHSGWNLILELNAECHEKENIAGEFDPHSGGTQIFVSPGVNFTSAAGWSGFASIGLPLHEKLNGIQNKADFRLLAGFGFSF